MYEIVKTMLTMKAATIATSRRATKALQAACQLTGWATTLLLWNGTRITRMRRIFAEATICRDERQRTENCSSGFSRSPVLQATHPEERLPGVAPRGELLDLSPSTLGRAIVLPV